jgi:hypothetical protein
MFAAPMRSAFEKEKKRLNYFGFGPSVSFGGSGTELLSVIATRKDSHEVDESVERFKGDLPGAVSDIASIPEHRVANLREELQHDLDVLLTRAKQQVSHSLVCVGFSFPSFPSFFDAILG